MLVRLQSFWVFFHPVKMLIFSVFVFQVAQILACTNAQIGVFDSLGCVMVTTIVVISQMKSTAVS